jgi:hypothetical protein
MDDFLYFKTGVMLADLVDVAAIPTKIQYTVTGQMKKVRIDKSIPSGNSK